MSTPTTVEPLLTSEFKFDPLKILLIVALGILASSLAELISWALLYRKESFKLNKGKL